MLPEGDQLRTEATVLRSDPVEQLGVGSGRSTRKESLQRFHVRDGVGAERGEGQSDLGPGSDVGDEVAHGPSGTRRKRRVEITGTCDVDQWLRGPLCIVEKHIGIHGDLQLTDEGCTRCSTTRVE